MYIKLGNTSIEYSNYINDFFIVSEIIDSNISYEKPIFVRTIEELDIWFGRNFSERDYLKELLETGVTLFLYKPIKTEDYLSNEEYINLSNFKNYNEYYNDFNIIENPLTGRIYNIYGKNGKYLNHTNNSKYNKYVYVKNSFINLDELPQNLEDSSSISLINRDSLRICYKDYSGPEFNNPKYTTDEYFPEYTEIIDKELLSNNLPSLERIKLGYETLSFDLDFSKVDFIKSGYIIFFDKVGRRVIIIFGDKEDNFPSENYYDSEVIINTTNRTKSEILNEFIDNLISFGYFVEKTGEFKYNIYSSFKLNCNYFYEIENFNILPNFQVTQNILSKYTENDSRIEFYSKVIGFDEEKIKINIEELDQDLLNYRITISKYDYSEVYEGSVGLSKINDENNLFRLDNLINSQSKIVSCKIIDCFIGVDGEKKLYVDNEERSPRLLTGSWELNRSIIETYDKDCYWRSFNLMMNEDISGYIDFFMIPDINKYVSSLNENYNYYTEYLSFLNSASTLGYQILIQNSDYDNRFNYQEISSFPENPEENVIYILDSIYYLYNNGNWEQISDPVITNKYRNDFLFNYTEDKDNRLIYFYRSMKISGNDRPGYYLFIKSLLESDSYSGTSVDILYNQPGTFFYEENDMTTVLSKYKSNYLNFNNLFYFYKDYQNGNKYNTTLWMRFCLGKISRELEKNKWNFLTKRYTGDMIKNISSILNKIKNTFSIIRSISITDYNFDFQNNKLNLSIYTRMSDLVDNDINLDITINYNNK